MLISLQEFAKERKNSGGSRHHLQNVYQHRPRTLLERQYGAVRYINGVARPVEFRIRLWLALFVIIAFILVLFFGVGLIGSTQEFSRFFLDNYFAIAVAWSLSSSALLAWYIKLLGGTTTEAAAGLLAMMGLWLVVMQVQPYPLVRESWEFVPLTTDRRLAKFDGLRRRLHSAAYDESKDVENRRSEQATKEDSGSDLAAGEQCKGHQNLQLCVMYHPSFAETYRSWSQRRFWQDSEIIAHMERLLWADFFV